MVLDVARSFDVVGFERAAFEFLEDGTQRL